MEEQYVTFRSHEFKRNNREEGDKLVLVTRPLSVATEQFLSIRTSLDFIVEEDAVKVMVVTSCEQNSGKTLISANLAISFARGGKKTLIIDGDLRNPSLQRYFYCDRNRGLSSIGDISQLKDNIFETEQENLYILPAGSININPADYFKSSKMKEIFNELRMHFDIIIVDTPPLLAVSDASVVSNYADGIIVVFRSGKTKLKNAKKTLRILEQSPTPVIGSILNDTNEFRDDYYYNYNYTKSF
ncbi:hypothetical protein BCR26_07220 [Enterococcus rivorum]|uniref:Tyrosine-protein kinase CpsD n=1 Tax=Enterococcus rivorum TaxID=762845 RepID=A0A1E5KSF5_9ENTE|nr:hypothetical protein BCR26_07220 [Enterococcus rivorum]